MEVQKVSIGLTGLFGVGYTYASYLCAKAGISQRCPLNKLSREHVRLINSAMSLEGIFSLELTRQIVSDVRAKVQKKSYQGSRHKMKLPVRGQRTKNNRKTARKGLAFVR